MNPLTLLLFGLSIVVKKFLVLIVIYSSHPVFNLSIDWAFDDKCSVSKI